LKLDLSKHRFNIGSFGRQSGKTTWGIKKSFWKPISETIPFGVYWYILQTHSAAEVAFDRFDRMIFPYRHEVLKRKPHETHKMFHLIGDKYVWFKSGENYEDLRSETLNGCIIDEYSLQDPKLWPMIVRPMLAKTKGWCDFLSTPKGFDHFYDLSEFAKNDKTGEWAVFFAPSTEAWWWTPEEIASAKATMTPEEFRQEILAEFINLFTGKVYTFSRENLSETNPFSGDGSKFHPYIPILVGLDFNVNPMVWELGQQRVNNFFWGDEIYVRNTNTMECAKILVEKYLSYKKLGHKSQPNIILCGDPAGNARNTKATESDYAIIVGALRAAGITYEDRTPKDHPPVKDRVNTVNAHFKAADGGVHCIIHPDCKKLIYDLERVSWKEGEHLLLDKSNPDLTHASDAIGYPIATLSPLHGAHEVGRLMMLRR